MNRGIAAAQRGTLTANFDAFAASYRGMLNHEHPRRLTIPAALETP